MKTELHIIFNPAANWGNNRKMLTQIIDFLNSKKTKYVIHETLHIGYASEIVKKLTTNNKAFINLISVGGDGTIHEIINGINNFNNIALGIIPAGTGNDYCLNLHDENESITKILDSYLQGKWKYVDFILLNDKHRIINSFGFGIDSAVIEYCNKKHSNSKSKYKRATYRKSIFFKVYKSKLRIDNEKEWKDINSLTFVVAKGKWYGGGVKIADSAAINDGYLTVTYVEKFSRITTLYNLYKLVKHGASSLKTYRTFKCKELHLEIEKNVYQGDGKLYTDTSTLNAKVVTKKLKLLI